MPPELCDNCQPRNNFHTLLEFCKTNLGMYRQSTNIFCDDTIISIHLAWEHGIANTAWATSFLVAPLCTVS